MTDCVFCKKPADAGANNGLHHNVCEDLVDERVRLKICTKCGKDPIPDGNCCFCDNCDAGSELLGYPGPQ